jgi:hypothetical protein
VWSYDPGTAASSWYSADEATKQHGTAELVSVEVDGTSYTAADLAKNATTDKQYYKDGVLCAPADSVVTMKLLPARGYQLLTDTLNDGEIALTPLEDDDSVGMYTFDMPADGVNLECGFEAAKDLVESDSADVTEGTISTADGAVKNGTLLLTITDMDDEDAKTSISAKAARPSDVVAYLDMSLVGQVFQGADGVSWDTELTSLPSAITLTLTLSDDIAKSSNQFYIIREHDGQYQQAAVTFDSAAKTITFKTDKFSSYAIAKGVPTSNTNANTNTGSNTGTNTGSNTSSTSSNSSSVPKTGDTNSTTPLAASALCSAAVAAVALRRMRKEQ